MQSPNLVALLSYYSEPDVFLKDMIRSLPKIGVTKLVALDGAYALYPDAKASSPVSNHRAIEKTANRVGIETFHYVPDEPWHENEVGKRWTLMDLAESITTDRDWWFVIDGDEVVTDGPFDLPVVLSGLDTNVATAELWEGDDEQRLRMFFRAERGLRPRGNHYTYSTEDGRVFWGGYAQATEAATDLPIRVRHRTLERPQARRAASLEFYDRRDDTGAEVHHCAWCGVETTTTIPFDWSWSTGGGGITAQRAGVCVEHLREKVSESFADAIRLGFDPRPHFRDLVQHQSA